MNLITLTATGQYYVVYRAGVKVSQHTAEREAIQKCGELLLQYPTETITYRHEYTVSAAMPVLLQNRIISNLTPDVTAPNTPAALTVTGLSETVIRVSWQQATDNPGASPSEAMTGVAGYRVYDGASALIAEVLGATTLFYDHAGRNAYTSYSYRIRSYDGAGNLSPISGIASGLTLDTTAPSTPTLSSSAGSSSSIVVTLATPATDAGSGVATYQLDYKAASSGTWLTWSSALTAGSFPVTVSGLSASTAYEFRACATDNSGNVGAFSATSTATTSAASSTFTLTANLVTESNLGQDGAIGWQSVFPINDGRIASVGVGVHSFDHSNAVRMINPASGSTSTDEWPWTYTPPALAFGSNRYIDTYDNHPSIYIPSENKLIWFGHGVFDFATGVKTWTYGNRSPSTQAWTAFVDASSHPNFGGVYNPAVAWCGALDMGAFYGVDGGGNGNPVSACLTTLERTSSGTWKLYVKSMTAEGMVNICNQRNSAVCIGPFYYVAGEAANESGDPTGGIVFYKVDLRTKTRTATLTAYPSDVGGFPQMVYHEDRKRILIIGRKCYEYDPDNDSAGWTNVTTANWPTGIDAHARGAYIPTRNEVWWTAAGPSFDSPVNYKWHKLVAPTSAAMSRYRTQTINLSFCPFKGAPELGFGGHKHSSWAWHPGHRRLYQCGGDGGYGASAFGQGEPGNPGDTPNLTTNDPVSPRSYRRSNQGLDNDMYSIDPYATGSVSYRLEHPYLPRNMGGGVREDRPPRPDQVGFLWDSVRSKFWVLQNHIRDDVDFIYLLGDGVTADPWANGTIVNTPTAGMKYEAQGTYSWVPNASGGAGTFTRETNNYLWGDLNYPTTPTYVGNSLRFYSGTSDHNYIAWTWGHYLPQDKIVTVSGNSPSSTCMFIFDPVAKTYQWRKLTLPTGTTYLDSFQGNVVVIDDYLYITVLLTQSGVRTSSIMRVYLPTALAASNGATLSSSIVTYITSPFSFSAAGIWESAGNVGANWHTEVFMVGLNRKLVLVGPYAGINNQGTTKLQVYHVDGASFRAGQASTLDFTAHGCAALPESNEIFLLPASPTAASPVYYYRVE